MEISYGPIVVLSMTLPYPDNEIWSLMSEISHLKPLNGLLLTSELREPQKHLIQRAAVFFFIFFFLAMDYARDITTNNTWLSYQDAHSLVGKADRLTMQSHVIVSP